MGSSDTMNTNGSVRFQSIMLVVIVLVLMIPSISSINRTDP
jgi:hypothetical protein